MDKQIKELAEELLFYTIIPNDDLCYDVAKYIIDAGYRREEDLVEVRHARWENNGNKYTCPVCKFFYFSNNEKWNFCPHCGAKMDGERR